MDNKPTILYVDDEPINLQLFEINFRKSFDIITAKDAFAGMEKLENYDKIKVVVSDMKMPRMNGIEFITEAKKKFVNTKFFMLSGFESTPEIEEAIESGLIIKYFRKPMNKLEIYQALEKAIG